MDQVIGSILTYKYYSNFWFFKMKTDYNSNVDSFEVEGGLGLGREASGSGRRGLAGQGRSRGLELSRRPSVRLGAPVPEMLPQDGSARRSQASNEQGAPKP